MKPIAFNKSKDVMGLTVIGERGQVVIPKEVREALKLAVGSRIIVMAHGNEALIMLPLNKMKNFMDLLGRRFDKLKNLIKESL
jgi:AbrB family looped-hinge helix DNA binding protein